MHDHAQSGYCFAQVPCRMMASMCLTWRGEGERMAAGEKWDVGDEA